MTRKTCLTCIDLYIKDFTVGVCDNPESGKRLVNPEDTCPHWQEEQRRQSQ